MATSSPDREVDFTTIRITKKDKQLLEQLALPKECAWETFHVGSGSSQEALSQSIKKKEKDNYKGMSPKYKRAIRSIERSFTAYRKQGVHQLSFTQIKDWVNQNSREGVSSPTLSNLLRRRPTVSLG